MDPDKIFENLDLLKLNQAVDDILAIPSETLEEYIQKYPATIIFFFSILDEKRKAALVEKFTIASLFYIVEEELRMLILREFSIRSDEMEDILVLSSFLDAISSKKKQEADNVVFSDVLKAMQILLEDSKTLKLKHFTFIDSLLEKKLFELLDLVLSRNINIALSIIIFISDKISFYLMDYWSKNDDAHILKNVPEPLLEKRIQFGNLHNYTQKEIIQVLPAKIQSQLKLWKETIQEKERLFSYINSAIQAYKLRGYSENEIQILLNKDKIQRKKLLDMIYKEIKNLKQEKSEIILAEIYSMKILNEFDINILKSVSDISSSGLLSS